MKKLKITLLVFFVAYCSYIAFLYYAGKKETFVFTNEFEGVVFIIYNSSDGVKLNNDNLRYDFTEDGILKVHNDFKGGFSPIGLTKYYYKDKNGFEHKIEIENAKPEDIGDMENTLKVWSVSKKVGECNGTKYVTFIVSRKENYAKILNSQWKQLNEFCVGENIK